ncbi:MAG TPA: hypothetical protein VHY08_22355 [Bacillota bacterium]|nr:hypothetical protein [Bacillota bacterium]
MKRILIVSMILLLLGTTFLGCGISITYESEKREINSMLNALQIGYLYENPYEVLGCYADPFIKDNIEYSNGAYYTVLNLMFSPAGQYYTSYLYLNRDIVVTSSSRATVYCINNYTSGGVPRSVDVRFSLYKSWGEWLITEERTLSYNY